MIPKSTNPWQSIKKPSAGFHTLRARPEHPLDFFWGKDYMDRYLLLLHISENDSDYMIRNPVKLKGITTDIKRSKSNGRHWFVLKLNRKENADIFYHLCLDLIECTSSTTEKIRGIRFINARLERWRFFLSRSKANLLSESEIQGLFSELLFIEKCLDGRIDENIVLNGWQGPFGGPHDFVMGKHAAEIKSISTMNKGAVRISSEHQLHSHLENLFLHVFFLAKHQNCSGGSSLNQISGRIKRRLFDHKSIDILERGLAEAGYLELKYYDSPCFSITGQTTYFITADFPKITPDKLASGLMNVTYDLLLSEISDYACEFPFSGEIVS